jgi:hypothetical protein
MNIKLSRIKLTLAIGAALTAGLAIIAYAQTSTPTILGVGAMDYSELVDGPATLTARRLIIDAGAPPSAWHYHPGMILAAVGDRTEPITNTGSVTIEDGCGGSETFGPGQGFHQIDGRVHRALNDSGVAVEEHNMFINGSDDPRLTVTLEGRRCGPASSVDECKSGGWARFDFPSTFENQGACIAYVLQRPRTDILDAKFP